MTTAPTTLALLVSLTAALVGSPAHAKRKKAAPPPPPSTDAANVVDSAPAEAPASTSTAAPARDTAASTSAPAASDASAAAPSKSVAQESDEKSASPVDDEAPPRAAAPKLKMEAPPPVPSSESVPPTFVPRRSNGNADSPEGVTWKASGWDVTMYGYVGLDVMQDSTQSFGTASSNTIIQRRGTPRGNDSQAQATARDSRIGFRLAPPVVGRVRASVNIETDFNAPPPVEYTEANVVTQAGLRMRHYYMKVETPIVDILAGQYHDLFGWGGKGFYPSTLAFLGITGEIYHRKPQIRLSKILEGDALEFEVAAAALAPVQKSGGYPDVEAGLRLAVNNWEGARQQAYGQPAIGRASLGVSAIGRHFEIAQYIENPVATVPGTGYGIAGDLFLPIIPASNPKDRGNALSFTGEFSIGTGISDMYQDLTGGLLFPSLPNSMDRTDPVNPPPVYTPNIDSGIVTFDANGRLRTANWQGLVLNLQYYLPIAGGRVWVAATHAEMKSTNIQEITPPAGWGGIYTRSFYDDATLFLALTEQIQLAFAVQKTHQWSPPDLTPLPPGETGIHTATNWRLEFGANMFF